jgi:hypothetical protein
MGSPLRQGRYVRDGDSVGPLPNSREQNRSVDERRPGGIAECPHHLGQVDPVGQWQAEEAGELDREQGLHWVKPAMV